MLFLRSQTQKSNEILNFYFIYFSNSKSKIQEGQHLLTGQRAGNFMPLANQ